jgi:hypothetical protein
MTEQFNLSEKIDYADFEASWYSDGTPSHFDRKSVFKLGDVKEFIRLLKKNLNESDFICSLHTMLYHSLLQHIEDEIDNLAGSKLVEEKGK